MSIKMIPEKIEISPASKINQLYDAGMYPCSIDEALSELNRAETEECLITKAEKSSINEIKISREPRIIKSTTGHRIAS